MRENRAVQPGATRSGLLLAGLISAIVVALALIVSGGKNANGTIVVQSFSEPLAHHAGALRMTTITQTSATGQFERILLSNSLSPRGFQEGSTSTSLQFYDPRDNEIYAMTWQSYVNAVYRYHHVNTHGPSRRGTYPWAGTFAAGTFAAAGRRSFFEVHLDRHDFRLAGFATVHGRRALKLTPVRQFATLADGDQELLGTAYVAPGTYYPIAYRLADMTVRWDRYSVLPATTADQRLVSLTAQHPTARVIHSASAWLRAVAALKR
jgi:hypothetical protein